MAENLCKTEKFAFIGAQSVGKTTMTEIFRRRFSGNPGIAVLDEGAFLFFQSHPEVTDRSVQVQERIQNLVLERERAAYQPGIKVIISDRSVIDPIVYTQRWDTKENADRLLQNVKDWLPTYTLFILLDPTNVPSDTDSDRVETPFDRLAIHQAFKDFCAKHNLPLVEVSGSLQERANKVDRIIYEHVRDKTVFEDEHGTRDQLDAIVDESAQFVRNERRLRMSRRRAIDNN